MVSITRVTSGLIFKSDMTLTGWTNGGNWSSTDDAAFCCFDPLPIGLLSGAPYESHTSREGQVFIDSDNTYYAIYDSGFNELTGEEFLSFSNDRWNTFSRLGNTPDGYINASGSASPQGCGNGWWEKRGSTYYRHRVTSDSPTGYLWDIWIATAITGPWTPLKLIGPGAGWMTGPITPGTTYFDGTTYHQVVSAQPTISSVVYPTIGRVTSSTADFTSYTRQDPEIFTSTWSTALGGRGAENGRLFYHPILSKYVLLWNATVDGTYTDANCAALSSSLTDWSSATFRMTQRISPMDRSIHAVGLASHITGPDGSLIYDTDTGIVPITYDGAPNRYAPGWHYGRSIFIACLEPSALALHYGGSSDTTSRPLSRSIACTNAVIEFGCELTSLNGSGGSLSVDLINGSNNGYRFTMTGNGKGSILKLTSGSPSVLASGSGSQIFDATKMIHRCKLVINNGTIAIFLNGELQASSSDSTTTSFTSFILNGKGIDCDVRCLSVRKSDTITVTGLTPGVSCYVRGYGSFPAGSVIGDGTGTGVFVHTHYPLLGLDINGVDYNPSGGIYGGDTLEFSGLPTSTTVAISKLAI